MRVLLLLLFLTSWVFASYSKSSLFVARETPIVISEYQLENARYSLIQKEERIQVSYGDGIFSSQLETVTKNLLSYSWIYNIVSTFTDEFESDPKRARFLLNVNKRELRFSFSF